MQMTVTEWIDRVALQLQEAGLHFGHGTDNARDEAAWLVLHAIDAPVDGRFRDWGRTVTVTEGLSIQHLAQARCSSGAPLAYLTGTAWFAGLEFEVTADVLVPRSPIAELILDEFRPWVSDPARLRRVLDLCTGCGCIAIATAVQLPQVQVDASDISQAALDVAARNIERHRVAGRVQVLRSDLLRDLPACQYDLIVANPPYVPLGLLADLPREYRAEPSLGLVSGADGLDAVLEIIAESPHYLAADGILICEVGESATALANALPDAPFVWLEFAHGGTGVFVLDRNELLAVRETAEALLKERNHVA